MDAELDRIDPANPASPRQADREWTPARAWMRALEANARAAEDPARTLPMVIGALGQKLGDRPALLSDRETMSFATLAQRMNLYSRWAIAEGVKPGDGDGRAARTRNHRDFRAQERDLAREGFAPRRIVDPLYVLDRAQGVYGALDAERFTAIESGAMRL